MLDTRTNTVANEIPLFGCRSEMIPSPAQFCKMELSNLSIQRPEPETSYSWSDFPMVVEKVYDTSWRTSSDSSSSSSSFSLCSSTSSDSMTHSSSFSSTGSQISDLSTSTSSRMDLLDESMSRNTSSSSTLSSSSRSIRFSQHLKVRTYSLILGEHPCCDDGLAIELGWEYDSHDGENIDMDIHEITKYTNRSRTSNSMINGSCSRRSHLDRKQLLLEVAGVSEKEINQRINEFEEERERKENLLLQQYLACM